MTSEEKQLLLKDICARLPYDVCVHIRYNAGEPCYGKLTPQDIRWFIDSKIEIIKPYLRPMSSMTEGEYMEFRKISGLYKDEGDYFSNHLSEIGNSIITERVMVRTIDWLNAHHFDYRGLIPMGLALEASQDMYKNE